MPSAEGGKEGACLSHMVALPRQREIARRPKRCLVVWKGQEGLALCRRASPIFRMVEEASGAQPPNTSATTGTNSISAALHAGRLAESLRRTHTWRGLVSQQPQPELAAAAEISPTRPADHDSNWEEHQQGRALELGTIPGASFLGPMAADWAALNRTSLML